MNLFPFKYQFFNKSLKVIKSCKTMDQLENTKNWINQIFKRVFQSTFIATIKYKNKIFWNQIPPSIRRNLKPIDPVENDIILLQIRNILSNEIIKKKREVENETN